MLRWDGELTPVYAAPNRYEITDLAAHGEDDLWLSQVMTNARVEDSALLHFDGDDWSELLTWSGAPSSLATHGDETWLMGEGVVRRVSSEAEPVDTPSTLATPIWTTLVVTDDDLWIGSGEQTMRHRRRAGTTAPQWKM